MGDMHYDFVTAQTTWVQLQVCTPFQLHFLYGRPVSRKESIIYVHDRIMVTGINSTSLVIQKNVQCNHFTVLRRSSDHLCTQTPFR
jgi:hypothetical protein